MELVTTYEQGSGNLSFLIMNGVLIQGIAWAVSNPLRLNYTPYFSGCGKVKYISVLFGCYCVASSHCSVSQSIKESQRGGEKRGSDQRLEYPCSLCS